jgi:hypothetical protein
MEPEQGMERKRRVRRSAQEWRDVLAAFANSALSVESYCRREGISRACFYRWRSILGNAEDRSLRHKAPSMADTVGGFVDLGTLGSSSARLELRLDLGGGVILQIARG